MMKKIMIVCAALLLIVLGYCARMVTEQPQLDVVERCDTLRLIDTVCISHPVYTSIRIVDTTYLAVTDTVRMRDTLMVQVPIEQKVYQDSTYMAVVSGYRPSLDRIEVYARTEKVTQIIKEYYPARWGVGVSAGYAATSTGFTPYIGLGVTYNICVLGLRR